MALRFPGQVASRVTQRLERWVRVPVTVEGAEHPLFGDLHLDRVSVPAAPVLGERVLAILRDVETRDGVVEILAGELNLEFEVPSAFEASAGRWNVSGVVRPATARQDLARLGVVRLRTLEVTARRLERPHSATEWSLTLEDVVVRRGRDDSIDVAASVREGDGWAAGRIDLSWWGENDIELRGDFEGVVEAHAWLPLVSDDARTLWARLRPEGEVDVELERVRISDGAVQEVEGRVVAYGLTLDVDGLGAMISAVRGAVRLDASGVALGESDGKAKVSGSIGGIEVELSGALRDGGGRIDLVIPPQRVERFDPGRGALSASACSRLIASLAPHGALEGHLTLSLPRLARRAANAEQTPGIAERVGATLAGNVRLDTIDLRHVPFLGGIRGELVLDPSPQGASARMALDGTRLPRVGRISGEVRTRWDAESLHLRAADLVVVSEEGTTGGLAVDCRVPLAAADSAESRAREELDLGHVRIPWPRGELKWFDLALRTGFGTLRGIRGSLTLGGDSGSARGEAQIANAAIVAGLLDTGLEPIELDRGDFRFRVGPHGAMLDRVTLWGDRRDLRCRGEVRFDGTIDFVCIVAPAARDSFRDENLHTASLEEWRLAAGEGAATYLVDGTLDEPHARTIDQDHPVFSTPAPPTAPSDTGEE